MAKNPLMFTRPETSCGKVFYPDRRAAEDHRIVLDVWNRATGGDREGYRLAVYQCVHCGGFHVGHKRIEKTPYKRVEPETRPLMASDDLRYLTDFTDNEQDDDLNSEPDSFSPEHRMHAMGLATEAGFGRPVW
jgi:hypothetical protein